MSLEELLAITERHIEEHKREKEEEAKAELADRKARDLSIPPPELFEQYHKRVQNLFDQLYDIAYELDCLCDAYKISEDLYDSDEWDLTPYKIEKYKERCQRMWELENDHE